MKQTIHLFLSLLILGIAISLQSCNDDEDGNSNCALNARIIAPVANMEFASGEDIPLEIEFNACTPIQSYLVSIRNRTTDKLVFILSEFANAETINISTSTILEVIDLTTMDIEIKAEDSEGNQIEEVIGSFQLTPEKGNRLTLRFNLMYEGETLSMGKRYEYPTGEQFEFSRFDMYMSDLSLQTADDNELMLREIDYLEMTSTYRDPEAAEDGFLYTAAGIGSGDFQAVHFNIGISPEMNETTPSDYPVSHPLGRVGDYWDGEGWESYIFASIEGRINIDTSNPDLEKGIALHLGSNSAYQEVTLDESFSFANEDGDTKIVDIDIDLKDLFIGESGDIYDIISIPQTHSTVHIPQVKILSDNLKNSINK